MASNPFDDPVFQTKEEAPQKSAWRSFVDTITGDLATAGEGALHALPDSIGFIGDIGSDLKSLAGGWHGGGSLSVPGMGPVSRAVTQSFDAAEGANAPRPQNTRQRYENAASRGAADMLVLGGPKAAGPAVLSGVGSGVGGQAGHDMFPDSEWAPVVGSLVGGAAGFAPHVGGMIRTGSLIRQGMSHPDFNVLVDQAIVPTEGGGSLEHPKVNAKSGATGPMQVTLETARDPGYGIRPWDGKTQADLARVGRQKFAVLLGKYDDPEKALAAYNWGEGNLNKAVAAHGDLWYDHAPKETQDYVAKGMTRVYGGPLKGAPGPDGLPTNGSVPPVDPRVYEDLMARQPDTPNSVVDFPAKGQENFEAFKEHLDSLGPPNLKPTDEEVAGLPPANREYLDQLTARERQEMDASVEKPPSINAATDRVENSSTNEAPPAPANDTPRLVPGEYGVNPDGNSYEGMTAEDHAAALARSKGMGAVEDAPPGNDNGGKPPKEPPSGGDEPPKPEGPTAVEKLQGILGQMDELRSTQDATLREIRHQRMQEAGKRSQIFTGESGAAAKMGALKGKFPETKIRSFRKGFGQDELDSLFNTIQQHPAIDWQTQLHATTGLQKLLVPRGNRLPTRSELNALNLVFPKDMIEGLKKHTSIKDILINSLNIPRALMASTDFSAPLRQGLFMIGRKEFRTAFPDMFKNAFSQKDFDALKSEIASRPTYGMMQEGGLSLTDVTQDLSKREEAFMSNYAEQIPGIGRVVKASDRAYVSFLNKIRADVFDSLVKSYEELKGESISKNPKALKDLCEYINAATGRGSLGRFNQSAPILSTVFFSPRLIASRLQLLNLFFYARLDPFVRKEALKDLFKFAGVALTVLGLAKMSGAEVVVDPRSTDFGKIKIKDTRFDILGGFQQYIRVFGQIITGQTKNANTGKVTNLPGPGLHISPGEKQGDYKPTTRKDVAENLVLNKFSPVLSFVVDLLRGSNAVGQKPDWKVEGPAKEGGVNWNNPVIQRMVPLIIQDTQDAFKEYGASSKIPYAVAGTGVFGVGTQTYQPIKHEKKTKTSSDPFKDPIFAGMTGKSSDPFKDEVFK